MGERRLQRFLDCLLGVETRQGEHIFPDQDLGCPKILAGE